MDGVTILNTIECGGFNGGALFFTIIFGILALSLIVAAIDSLHHKDQIGGIISIILGLIVVLICIVPATIINTPKYNEYQVAVDDTVRFNEFQKKYEIVDQNGELYTVVERNEE